MFICRGFSLAIIAVLAVAAAVQGNCPQDWEEFQGSCYSLGETGLSFHRADEVCSDSDGHLVEINSAEENIFVKGLLRKEAYDYETSAWVGAIQDFQGAWEYVDSREDLAFTDWATPARRRARFDRKCVSLSREHDWAWTEEDCNTKSSSRTLVCEKNLLQRECFQGSCYQLMNKQAKSFVAAQEMCRNIGAYVVQITSQKQQEFVRDFLNGASVPRSKLFETTNVWLGATDKKEEGEFKWQEGNEDFDFQNWAPNEPNNAGVQGRRENCIAMDADKNWEWNDVMCDPAEIAVLCESANVSPITG